MTIHMYFPDSYSWTLSAYQVFSYGGSIWEARVVFDRLKGKDKEEDSNAWWTEWTRMADYNKKTADEAKKQGHRWTARENYFHAQCYYILAERFLEYTDPRKVETYKKGLECFKKGSELCVPPVERVEVPYENTSLPGYFLPVPGKEKQRSPCVVCVDGGDVMKEQMYFMYRNLPEYGIACLIMDTPGIGEAIRLRNLTYRYDYEVPVGACVNYLETRSDVDAEKIEVSGHSFGGYLAPRAAAFEKRIKACCSGSQISIKTLAQPYLIAAFGEETPSSIFGSK